MKPSAERSPLPPLLRELVLAPAAIGLSVLAAAIGASAWVVLLLTLPALAVFFRGQLKDTRAAAAKFRQRQETRRRQSNVEDLARKLPVGLFIAEGNKIVRTNQVWDELIGRRADEAPDHAFERSAILADAVQQRLALAEVGERGVPATSIVRHTTGLGLVRHLRTYITPIAPGASEVVGLTFDVTKEVLAEQAIASHAREQETVNRLLRVSMAEMTSSIEALVRVLVRAVEAKDPYTAGHSERVTAYALQIGEALGLTHHDLRNLEIGCLVHDIGKIGVPDALLTKPSSLTDDEFLIVAEHAAHGARILSGLPLFQECLPIVRNHHERLDGSGYPDRLRGDEIPLLVRIAMVADAFDAMTSTRAYRHGMHPIAALRELENEAQDGMLDPLVVSIFADMVNKEGLPGRLKARRPRKEPDSLADLPPDAPETEQSHAA
jgi:hypothetical protein